MAAMSDFYTQMQEVATSLLGPSSDFAQGTLTLRRTAPGDGPPYDPGPSTETDYPLSGAVKGVSQEHIDGTLIQVGDKIATVAVPEVEPTTADKLLIDGSIHQIIKVERKPQAGTAVAFLIFARV
jgi:hypothetical protein